MKKLSAILLCCLMIFTCSLAGCATFSIDRVKYYNQVVATVGDTDITRHDLITAYNSYGYSSFVTQQGQTESEAMSSTLDLLIDRELLYQYALDQGGKYRPREYQVNEVIKEIFDSLDEQMDDYITEAKGILNIEISSGNTDEEEDETAYLRTDYKYQKRATVTKKTIYYTDADKTITSDTPTEYYDITYEIKYTGDNTDNEGDNTDNEVFDSVLTGENKKYLSDFTNREIIQVIMDTYLSHLKDNVLYDENANDKERIYDKVLSLMAEDLINYEYYLRDENGNEYSKNKNDLIYRYFERTYDSQIQSQYLTNIRDYYLENENLSIQLLLDEFNRLYTNSYNSYVNRLDRYKNDIQDIGTSGDTVLYHPTDLGYENGTKTQFGYFIHTLINLNSTQLAELEMLKNNPEINPDSEYYKTTISNILSQSSIEYRGAKGTVAGSTTLANVMKEYENIDGLSDFIDFMFKYTGDTATLSAGMPYVVGNNGYSGMKEAFTDEAVRLMTEGNVGDMSKSINISTSIDDICITSYGIHLLYYVGPIDSFDVQYGDRNAVCIHDKTDGSRYNLFEKPLNPLTGETYFDMLFDAVYPAESDESNYTSNTGYSDHEELLIELSQAKHTVTKYTTILNSTTASI